MVALHHEQLVHARPAFAQRPSFNWRLVVALSGNFAFWALLIAAAVRSA